jgi:hypothetical protein
VSKFQRFNGFSSGTSSQRPGSSPVAQRDMIEPTKWSILMLTRLLAASILAAGLATSAMAQSSDVYTSHTRHRPVATNEQSMTVDPNTTASIGDNSGLSSLGNSGPLGPCASDTAGPDANAGLSVNDQYCGK